MDICWWSCWIDHRLLQSLRIPKHHMFLVHDGMAELVFESILLQELLDPHSNERNSQHLIDSGPPVHIDRQHLGHQVPEFAREMHRYGIELSSNNMHGQKMHIDSFEWRLERTHLIEHDTKRPNVTFEGIWSTFNDFRREIIRRSNH